MTTPDTILLGGPVVTLNPDRPRAEAVAVSGERILAVGERAEILELRSANTEVVDLEGDCLLPGTDEGVRRCHSTTGESVSSRRPTCAASAAR